MASGKPEMKSTRKISLRRQLDTFDTTSLVVDSAIGPDILVIPSLIAALIMPVSILILFELSKVVELTPVKYSS
jgi:hypothetical protein